MYHALKPLFQPANVAVIGASNATGKPGNSAIRYLARCGYEGGIFPVNPGQSEIEGLPCYSGIGAIDAKIDCALIVIPAGPAVEAVRECAEAGVGAVIIGATGYAEMGTGDGRRRQAELVAIARRHGLRILGPNTNGIFNASDKLSLGFNTSHGDALSPGPVSIAAHSGALFNCIAPRLRDLGAGLSKFVPVGNEADLDMLDILEYFIEDPDTGVIGLIMEAISDGARLRRLSLRAQNAGKPIVVLKLGRSAAGAGAAKAHSTRLAGSARAYDALFKDCGFATVPTVEAMAGAAALLINRAGQAFPENNGLIGISTTGGGAALLADQAAARGIPLAGDENGQWQGGVAAVIATFDGAGPIGNPTDTGALGGTQRLTELFEAQESDGCTGPLAFFTHLLPTLEASLDLAARIIARKARTGTPAIVIAPGGLTPEIEDGYRDAGIPVFNGMATAFDSLHAYYQAYPISAAPLEPVIEAHLAAGLKQAGQSLAAFAGRDFLNEAESADLLRGLGLPMVESRIVDGMSSAAIAAEALGYPVVLKALAPGVAHKSRLGFVIDNIAGDIELAEAVVNLEARIAALDFTAAEVPLVLQPMAKGDAEIVLGVAFEPGLGHFLLAGLGGVYTEQLDAVVLIPIPAQQSAIEQRLAESPVGRLIAAIGPLSPVIDALWALSLLVAGNRAIASIDINPLLVEPSGCTAVDALIVLAEPGDQPEV
jgi:acyl-CoA synthetase (NDP forming)